MNAAIAAARLRNQRVADPSHRTPAELVGWMGAVQAQDYPAARWAVALRLRGRATSETIDRALENGRIVRTHVLRPTWHFVVPADLRWMLELTAPRVRQALAFAYRYYELDPPLRARAASIWGRALAGGEHLTRAELGEALTRKRVDVSGVRLALLTVDAELEAVMCTGPRRGKQMTYALLDARVPAAAPLDRDEAIGELTRRYLRSHGPATVRDFAWWSGLTARDVRRGLEIARARQHAVAGSTYWTLDEIPRARPPRASVHLLPVYDEYVVAYRDLAAVPRAPATRGRLQPAIVAGGEIAGTWRTLRSKSGLVLEAAADRPLSGAERRALAQAVARYQRFAGVPLSLAIK